MTTRSIRLVSAAPLAIGMLALLWLVWAMWVGIGIGVDSIMFGPRAVPDADAGTDGGAP